MTTVFTNDQFNVALRDNGFDLSTIGPYVVTEAALVTPDGVTGDVFLGRGTFLVSLGFDGFNFTHILDFGNCYIPVLQLFTSTFKRIQLTNSVLRMITIRRSTVGRIDKSDCISDRVSIEHSTVNNVVMGNFICRGPYSLNDSTFTNLYVQNSILKTPIHLDGTSIIENYLP